MRRWDLKPGNLFLRDGQIDRVTLLDFGVARRVIGGVRMTRTGMVVGTLDYMAPEQARGQRDIGPQADIFSLGCVFYECLVGQPPFYGEQVSAVLAKILFEEAPPLRRLWPQVPPPLEALVGRMLAKRTESRPADASRLLGELDGLEAALSGPLGGPLPAVSPPVVKSRSAEELLAEELIGREMVLVSVVIAAVAGQELPESAAAASGDTEGPARHRTLRLALADLGAHSEVLADGSLVATVTETGSATDQVTAAARCALLVQKRWPEARVALATGRRVLSERLAVGEAIDRAARLLRSPSAPSPGQSPTGRPTAEGVLIEEVSAALLDARFFVTWTPARIVLHGESLTADESRPVLGKPTPCLGREHELGVLDANLVSCIDEPEARVVLVTAPPGFGKSRLRHELQRRLQARSLPLLILFGRGEPMSCGSPYALLCQALRRVCELQVGEPLPQQQAKLQARLSRHLAAADAQRVTEFLGEICNVPFSADDSVKLQAARSDPKLMRDQVEQAFIDWLGAETRHQPVLLILEDLHWGDLLTVRILDTVLRELKDQPLLLLAFARPEISELFPNLWAERGLQELRLPPLSRRVSERLVYQILGRDVRPETVNRIVEQSGGNALYLEELVRAVADGKGDALPETVLAMIQSRLLGLEPGARRALRCASVFGTVFWAGGVQRMQQGARGSDELAAWLDALVAAELIEAHRDSRFPGQAEYAFRHAIIREAAYSMLTEPDKQHCHRVAAGYLGAVGEGDAMILAEHLRAGGEREQAIAYYIQAAEKSYDNHDNDGTLARAAKGEACGAHGEALGRLRALRFQAHYFRLEWQQGFGLGLEALALLPAGSFWWCKTMSELFIIAGNINQADKMRELTAVFASVSPMPDARGPYIATAAQLVSMFSFMGLREQAALFLDSMQRVRATLVGDDVIARGSLAFGHGWFARLLGPDPWLSLNLAQECVLAFQSAGSLRELVKAQTQLGMAQLEIGQAAAGEATLRSCLAIAERLGEALTQAFAKLYLATLLAESDAALDEALELADGLRRLPMGPNFTGCALVTLARILGRRGRLAEAEEEARRAIGMLAMMQPYQLAAYESLIRILLATGPRRAAEARDLADAALEVLARLGGHCYNVVAVRLAVAEACHAAGDVERAHRELRLTLATLAARAGCIPDDTCRLHFLTQVRENARTRELAQAWLGETLPLPGAAPPGP